MSTLQTLGIALLGIAVVLVVLSVLALFVMALSRVVGALERKKPAPQAQQAALPVPASMPKPAAPAGVPLPENQSQGELTLVKTSEETAAMIMAIIADDLGAPLNTLRFTRIALLED